uniref:Uncharacterized protein n=1 Tax=Arundo donax TaxID=35708 RepID=A0A0A9AER2_ARUDO
MTTSQAQASLHCAHVYVLSSPCVH